MPDYQDNPYGLPQNPLVNMMAQDQQSYGKRRFAHGGRHPTSEQNPFVSKMEAPGITSTSGTGMASSNPVGNKVVESPEQIATPDAVSALDPAYSMHPILKALLSSGGMSPLSPMQPSGQWGTAMQQLGPMWNGKGMSRTQLLSALGLPGMEGTVTKTQGEAL